MSSIHVEHRAEHALVTWPETLTLTTSAELVDAVDTAIECYFYREVTIRIVVSPGGYAAAFRHLYEAMRRWRGAGVRVRTHAIASAQSAAALMLSLADERVAEPDARLLYHRLRVGELDSVTARDCALLGARLEQADALWLERLAERALETRGGVAAPTCEPGDRRVLEDLAGGGRRRSLGRLARTLERTVTRAVEARERDTLVGLYRRLSELDVPISAALALTLRLIDRIGASEKTSAVGAVASPGLTVPQWRGLYPPGGAVAREALTRHVLVLGETGSGKTASAILPVVAAMAHAPAGRIGCTLVIDPKRELAPVLERIAPERVHAVRGETTVLDLMAGPGWRLGDDLAAGRYRSATTRMLMRLGSFIPSSPAAVLLPHEGGGSNMEFFAREACELLIVVLSLIAMVTAPDAPAPDAWLGHDDEARGWVEALRAEARGSAGARGPNALALAAWVLGSAAMQPPARESDVVENALRAERWLLVRIARAARTVWGTAPGEAREVLGRVAGYWGPIALIDGQYVGTVATARGACAELASPALARSVYFGFEPGWRDAGAGLDLARLVARDAAPSLVLYQPSRGESDTLRARVLKALFFEAVLDDPDRAQGGAAALPLVGYVADEFHRFVTSDPVHGEQSFLDCCRSYGAMCVLASQSLSSLAHALAHGGGNKTANEEAISVLWTNTATKLVFRSTDARTAERLRGLSPQGRPGLAAIVDVRPLSTLATGECYAALSDGRFERRQLAPFVEAAPARTVSAKPRRARGRSAS